MTKRREMCEHCQGTGKVPDGKIDPYTPATRICPKCKGLGTWPKTHMPTLTLSALKEFEQNLEDQWLKKKK